MISSGFLNLVIDVLYRDFPSYEVTENKTNDHTEKDADDKYSHSDTFTKQCASTWTGTSPQSWTMTGIIPS
jgi:hypothetical protein